MSEIDVGGIDIWHQGTCSRKAHCIKDSLLLDETCGSGIILHAINLLNAEDGGNRHCIMATNNEISAKEEEHLIKTGYKKGDNEWEKLGISRYVTWPRTLCSINGVNIYGDKLSGSYGFETEKFKLDEESSVLSKKQVLLQKRMYIDKQNPIIS